MLPDSPFSGIVQPQSFRIFNDTERALLSVEIQGYVINMANSGLLSVDEIETVMSRLIYDSNFFIDLEDLKFLIRAVLLESVNDTARSFRMVSPDEYLN